MKHKDPNPYPSPLAGRTLTRALALTLNLILRESAFVSFNDALEVAREIIYALYAFVRVRVQIDHFTRDEFHQLEEESQRMATPLR